MKIITVDEIGLIESFAAFGVKFNYSRLFLSKCHVSKGRVALTPFMFNDTVHLDNPHQWFAANAAFWVRAYRESETLVEQVETMASIRALYFLSGSLGQGHAHALISTWFDTTKELHGMGALNLSPLAPLPKKYETTISPLSFH
ncbi:hypothetical protein [Rahnella aceris]|jgi:hypothetical protein